MISEVQMGGKLVARKVNRPTAPLSWRVRNAVRWTYIWGILTVAAAHAFSKITGIPTIVSQLAVKVNRGGGWVDYGVVSRRVVTDTGVAFLVDAWQNLTELESLNYHGVGTGTTAEAASQTGLITESTTALNPDSTRATGTRTEPAANQLKTAGTVTFDATAAITEHGIFSQAATGGGTLWDRSVFSAINVASGDSIAFEYTVTFTSGG